MAVKFFNTLSRKLESFKPIRSGEVSMYTCGPTVYDFAHIGNFRAYVCADVLKRYLRYCGFKVKHVMNITDVDDKTIKNSKLQKLKLKDYTDKFTDAFFEDLDRMNIVPADVFPRATETIPEMVEIISVLLDKGFAYKGDDGSIYYNVRKFDDYGKLAHINVDELKVGARVKQDEYEKEQAQDFALWKAWDESDGDVFWETKLGKGRPGWHIECSAMSMKFLAEQIDIHTGGIDLVFPHHQNEIAQSEAFSGKSPFVRYWFHNEYLQVEGKKMSKSLGNFYTLRDLLKKGYDPKAIRYLLLSTHYRTQLNFTFDSLDGADSAVRKINDFIISLRNLDSDCVFNERIPKLCNKAKKEFEKGLDDDLNITVSLAAIFDFMREINVLISENKVSGDNRDDVLKLIDMFDSVLGIVDRDVLVLSDEVKALVADREKARVGKDWKNADLIRDKLLVLGIVVEDSLRGPVCKKK